MVIIKKSQNSNLEFGTCSGGRSVRGTGLNPAIIRHIMNAHEGRIRVKSKVGEVSIFTFFSCIIITPICGCSHFYEGFLARPAFKEANDFFSQGSEVMISVINEVTGKDRRVITQRKQIDTLERQVEELEKKTAQMKEVDMNLKEKKKTLPKQ